MHLTDCKRYWTHIALWSTDTESYGLLVDLDIEKRKDSGN